MTKLRMKIVRNGKGIVVAGFLSPRPEVQFTFQLFLYVLYLQLFVRALPPGPLRAVFNAFVSALCLCSRVDLVRCRRR